MSFDIDVSGLEDIEESITDIQDDVDEDSDAEVVSTADYSIYLELGTENMPPYPFFRPAIRELKANPNQFVQDNFGREIDEAESTDQAVWWVAQALEQQIKTNATAQASGRSPGTADDHPAVDTGNLRNGIKARRL